MNRPKSTLVKPFSLLVKPASADCNLRCGYCFYLKKGQIYPEYSVHRMEKEILSRLISCYMATEQPVYSICWQGGEPALMGLDFFKDVVQMQQCYGRPGAIVSNSLQTNSTLITDEMACFFKEYNFLIGCSLDGPESIHDHYRTDASGRGSYRDVMKGVELLRKHSVDFNILTLVNSYSVKKPQEIYSYLCAEDFLFQQYIPCVEFDEKGHPLPFSVTGEEWGEFLCKIFDMWYPNDIDMVSIRYFESILRYLIEGNKGECTLNSNCCQYLVVEHNGDIYPCDFFVEKKYRLGNIMDNNWEEIIHSGAYREFGAGKSMLCTECITCEFSELCIGDCQKHRIYGKDFPREKSWLCNGLKRFYSCTMERFEMIADSIKLREQRDSATTPLSRTTLKEKKTGRNSTCPCGSGLKFKKCCG